MVLVEISCVQTYCAILSELHSICYNVPYGQTQAVFSQFSVILNMRPHHRWVYIVVSHSLCKDWFHACQNTLSSLTTKFSINRWIEISQDHFRVCYHQTFDCPVGVWVIEQHAIILSATVRSPTVFSYHGATGVNVIWLTKFQSRTYAEPEDCHHICPCL